MSSLAEVWIQPGWREEVSSDVCSTVTAQHWRSYRQIRAVDSLGCAAYSERSRPPRGRTVNEGSQKEQPQFYVQDAINSVLVMFSKVALRLCD